MKRKEIRLLKIPEMTEEEKRRKRELADKMAKKKARSKFQSLPHRKGILATGLIIVKTKVVKRGLRNEGCSC